MAKRDKKTTIDDLAQMVQGGFVNSEKRISERFDKMDKRFDKIDEKIEETWNKLDSLERRIIFLENTITKHSKTLAKHSKILAALQKELREVKTTICKYQKDRETDQKKMIFLEKRVERLEIKVFA